MPFDPHSSVLEEADEDGDDPNADNEVDVHVRSRYSSLLQN